MAVPAVIAVLAVAFAAVAAMIFVPFTTLAWFIPFFTIFALRPVALHISATTVVKVRVWPAAVIVNHNVVATAYIVATVCQR